MKNEDNEDDDEGDIDARRFCSRLCLLTDVELLGVELVFLFLWPLLLLLLSRTLVRNFVVEQEVTSVLSRMSLS